MQLIAQIGSRSDPKNPYRKHTVEADNYETAYQQVEPSRKSCRRFVGGSVG